MADFIADSGAVIYVLLRGADLLFVYGGEEGSKKSIAGDIDADCL